MRKAAKAKPKDASNMRLAAGAAKTTRSPKSAKTPRAGARRAAATPTTDIPVPAMPARIELPAECTLRDAAALQALLAGTLSPTDSVIIAAGTVTRIDAAALQLLVAFTQRESAARRRVVWQDPSADFMESSARLGLAGILGLDAPAGGTA